MLTEGGIGCKALEMCVIAPTWLVLDSVVWQDGAGGTQLTDKWQRHMNTIVSTMATEGSISPTNGASFGTSDLKHLLDALQN